MHAPDQTDAGTPAERVLILASANQAATEELLDAVRARASAGPACFHLLLPDPAEHAEFTSGERLQNLARAQDVLESALPLLTEAAGGPVEGSVSVRHDPMDAIDEAVRGGDVDEIILSTVHHGIAEGLHVDLPRRVRHLGLPLTTVFVGEPAHKSIFASLTG